ncbi:MAG: transglutaminase domain-containing protein [Candidatus Azobacteroides sp.]|nr:transglutaminase domain-containing protein [Candidatus Azobacteroides sp.]
MKKVIGMLFCLLPFVPALAQSPEGNREFENYSRQQTEVVTKAFNDKNYDLLLSLLLDWEKQYTALPQEQAKIYSSSAGEGIYYNLACTYSLLNQKDKAVDYFKKALSLGYDDRAYIEADTDLDNIRKDKRFIKLLAGMPKKDSYIEILQKAAGYAPADTAGLPRFTYEPMSNGRLKSVREYFKLDSVAGQGDEISKIIRLKTWVHNTIRHDGNHRPECSEYDAMDLYNYYKTTGRGVNCRMLAIVLNECYLSMGFKSRYVTCLPEDKNDADCHVITCVYSQTLNKWVWMDPTFNACPTDENGTLLSIEEVRGRLIENKPIVLNEDANWNNENKQTKSYYIDIYMAKNLYWIQCPAYSCFNAESPYRNNANTYISLTPGEFDGFNRSGQKIVTHDPAYFWQAPE